MSGPRTDGNGVIRLLHIGKAWFYPGHPAPVLSQDPRINYYPVPALQGSGALKANSTWTR